MENDFTWLFKRFMIYVWGLFSVWHQEDESDVKLSRIEVLLFGTVHQQGKQQQERRTWHLLRAENSYWEYNL